jgi:hypothetical protein
MRILLQLLCLFPAPLAAQQYASGDDARALLLEVRKKVMLTVRRLPKYLCTETIDRVTFKPEARSLGRACDDLASRRKKPDWKIHKDTSDRLRLDVAISSTSEMYSWAGEDRFQDRSLADLVRRGATSTGAFAAFLTAIFGGNAATFTYNGDVNPNGRALVEFGFRVPFDKSSYSIGTKLNHTIVAYGGTFLVDPRTFELVRLIVHVDQLPAELKACEAITTLDYGSVRLNNYEFILPTDARLQVVKTDGGELQNHTVFSGCHEFLGESSLTFDAPSATGEAEQRPAVKAVKLPAGLPFRVALTRAIDTATAAAGDPVRAELTSPIKEKHNGVLVPAGAAVTGRIVQIERSYGPASESLTLAFKLETIEANGVPQPFAAKPESSVKGSINSNDSLVIRRNLGSFDQIYDEEDPDVGFLEFPDVSRDYVIKPGVALDCVTTSQK